MKMILWQVVIFSSILLLGNGIMLADDTPITATDTVSDNAEEPNFSGDTDNPSEVGGDSSAGGGSDSNQNDNSPSNGNVTDEGNNEGGASGNDQAPSSGNAQDEEGGNIGNQDEDNPDSETDADSENPTGGDNNSDAGSPSNGNAGNNGSGGNNLNQADNSAKTAPQTAVMIDLELTDEEVERYFLPEEPEPFTNGEVVDNYDGTVTYTPEPDFYGTDTFTYTVLDVNTDIPEKYVVKVEVSNEVDAGGPASCQVYAVHDQDNSDSQLLTIDTYGGGYKTIALGPMHIGFDIEGIGIHPKTHELYAISGWDPQYASQRTYGTLYKINSHTGKLITVGATGFRDISSLAFHPQEGSLWAVAGYDREPKGIIKIRDLTTGDSRMVLRFPETAENIEGLAWSQDGSVLYGSQGKALLGYAYADRKLTSMGVICPNILAGTADANDPEVEIEALETMLIADRLMLSINRPNSTDLYEFDAKSCQIVPERTLRFETDFPDVESIAWPLDCQPTPEVESLEVDFAGKDNALFCPKRPRWITIRGKVILEPAESEVYVQTGWSVVAPKTIDCVEGEACESGKHDQVLFEHGESFEIKGWWPGLPKNEAQVARVRFNIGIQDTGGSVLSYYGETSKTLYGSVELCDAAAAERAAAKAEQEAEANVEDKEEPAENSLTRKQKLLKAYLMEEQGATSVEFEGNNLYALIGEELHHGVLSEFSDASKAFTNVKLVVRNKGEPDENGYLSFAVIYPSKTEKPSERDLLLYQGALTLDKEQADALEQSEGDAETDTTEHPTIELIKEVQRINLFKDYLTQQLNASSVVVEGNDVYALLGNELHHAVLGKMLDPAEEAPAQLELLAKGRHFHIVYPDGQKQLLIYQGASVIDDETDTDEVNADSDTDADAPADSDSDSADSTTDDSSDSEPNSAEEGSSPPETDSTVEPEESPTTVDEEAADADNDTPTSEGGNSGDNAGSGSGHDEVGPESPASEPEQPVVAVEEATDAESDIVASEPSVAEESDVDSVVEETVSE